MRKFVHTDLPHGPYAGMLPVEPPLFVETLPDTNEIFHFEKTQIIIIQFIKINVGALAAYLIACLTLRLEPNPMS